MERHEIGTVRKTAETADAVKANRKTYIETARRAGEIREMVGRTSGADETALILDADSEVPYEHVIGVVNALKEEGIHNVEFAANPRHAKMVR